jgi:RNA polymerase sigma-70 factor (ECF subfamily)
MKSRNDAQTRIMADLLAKTAQHDKNSFARLYRLASPKLFAISLRILKQEGPAQDCLQDAFLNIWQKAGSYKPGLAAPMTWMTTIVRNRAIDQMRKQSRDAYSEESEIQIRLR